VTGKSRSAVAAILLGGFVAGTIDIGAAALINTRSPVFILHAIAGGLLAMASFDGGMSTAVLGLVLQWVMSLIIAALFVLAAMRIGTFRTHWLSAGLGYGVGIFFVMNYVVVPLSAWHRFPNFTPLKFGENMLAMLLFGLIVAFFARDVTSARRA